MYFSLSVEVACRCYAARYFRYDPQPSDHTLPADTDAGHCLFWYLQRIPTMQNLSLCTEY
jgi:hypothetical protein